MKNAALKKLFAIVLVITMCVSLLPVSAAAEEPADDAEQTEKVVYQADQEPAEEEGQADEEEQEDEQIDEKPGEEPDEQPDEGETSETVRVVFVCDPAETEVTVYDAEGAEIDPEEDGSYLLVPGSYTYSASCEGYVYVENVEFVIEDGAETQEIEVYLQTVQESDSDGTDSDVPAAQAEIKITAPKTELEVGETMQLEVVCENESTDLSSAAWSSSDEEILIVDETGLVTAVGEGKAKVYVSDSASKLSADIVIRVNIAQTNPAISTFAATPPVLTSFTPIWPVTTTKRINALDHYSNGDSHRGIDINAGRESVVYAVADGVVAETNNTCSHDSDTSDTCGYSWGNYVLIKHNVNGTIYYSRYAHLTKDSIPSDIYPGASVACNQEIGKSGSSGSSSGPHLHLELYTGNRSENAPKSFQYYTGNSTVLDGMSFSSHIPTSSVYFGDWVSSNCILSNGIYVYNGSPADDIIATGTCGAEGDNLKWTLNKDGVLTISGSGEMADYAIAGKKESSAPWFDEASQIKSVVIESGVTSIGHYAFFYCTELTSVSIPDSVTSIQGYAFYGCTGLASLTIPASVENIGTPEDSTIEGYDTGTFVWSSGITSINVDPANAVFTSVDGVMYDKTKTKLLVCPPGRTGSFSIPSGVTELAGNSLYSCAKLTNVDIPNTVTKISGGAFDGCYELTRVTIPKSVTSIGSWAFIFCPNLKEIEFCHSATAPLEFGGMVFWQDKYEAMETTVIVPDADNINHAISGYDWANDCRTVTYKAADKPADDGTEIKLDELATDQAGSGGLVRIDVGGTVYTADENGSFGSVEIAENKAVFAAVSGYNTTGGTDPHSQYPTGMEVYLLYNDNGTAKAKRIPEFDDLLRYSGCSIRITGNKGIRMITSVDGALKASLINDSVAGYTLEEYGTLLCFSSEMVNGSLCLEDSYARHNYAYSRAAGTDPVFKYVGSTIQYTNVLVGFDLKQCADDIAMRPYIVLSDESGNRFTIYGGIVQRSIGYIAYQNRSAFASDDPAYDYIWDIIHHVYGDKYDADYKK